MNDIYFKKIERNVLLGCLIMGVIWGVISLFIIGFDLKFLAGVLIGSATGALNFHLFGQVISLYQKKEDQEVIRAGILYIARLVLYGACAVLCLVIGKYSLIAYALGILGMAVSVMVCALKSC